MFSNHCEPGDPVEEQTVSSSLRCSVTEHSTCGASPCAPCWCLVRLGPRRPRRNTHLCFNLSYRTQMRFPTRRTVLEATNLLRLALGHSPPAAPSALAWVLAAPEGRPPRHRQLPRRDMREPGDNQPRTSSQEYTLGNPGAGPDHNDSPCSPRHLVQPLHRRPEISSLHVDVRVEDGGPTGQRCHPTCLALIFRTLQVSPTRCWSATRQLQIK